MSRSGPPRCAPRLSPALVVAVCALLVALGGTTYAVSALPHHSVGAAQLKKNAVRSKTVKDHSLRAKDLRAGQLPPSRVLVNNTSGNTTAVTAVDGGGADTVVGGMGLPAGTFYVRASVTAINHSAVLSAELRCGLRSSGDTVAAGTFGLFVPIEPDAGSNNNRTFFVLDAAYHLTTPGSVRVECTKGAAGQSVDAAATVSSLEVATAAYAS